MLKIPALEKLIHELAKLPGIGPKTAQRLAYHILKVPDDYSQRLSHALVEVKALVKTCSQCFSYTDKEICHFCEDPHRSNDVLCVVEDPLDISRIESSGAFKGRYHVLHGVISPLDGVTPDDLKVRELLQKINARAEQEIPVKEIIFALDADLEGDTTVLYLSKLLADKNIKLSRIAHGVPIGGDIDYIDDRTIGRAFMNRVGL